MQDLAISNSLKCNKFLYLYLAKSKKYLTMEQKLKPLNCKLSEYEGWLAMREYWDDYSDEWNSSTIEEKLVNLANFVKQGGDLNIVLNDYTENRDAIYRYRIQFCVFRYIERLISGNYFAKGNPIIERIKRLEKAGLVSLLKEELSRSVKDVEEYDEKQIIKSYWQISDEFINKDDILNKIEREHWRNNPNEGVSFYMNKDKKWDKGSDYSIW